MNTENMHSGINNLLKKCMHVQPGDRVLVVLEPESEDFYDDRVGDIVASRIRDMGGIVSTQRPELIIDPSDFPANLTEAMEQSDHTLFFSRLGDYARFTPMTNKGSTTISYTYQPDSLSSPFSGVCYQLMTNLLNKLESELLAAHKWRITCDKGTDISGTFCWDYHESDPGETGKNESGEFTMALFPITTFRPVPCYTATGTVALSRWLIPGAAAKVDPSTLHFDGVVFAEVKDGYLTAFKGNEPSAAKVSEYYDFVSRALNTNRNRIHSWHAGINPHAHFKGNVDRDLEKWGAISFASPRYLHFHTCGDHPPGELAWSVFNPTIIIDDEVYWQDGQLAWLKRTDNLSLISQVSGADSLLAPSLDIGI
ncbi:MAG: hypothetical protein GKR96_10770 [Gammaproteobacteria bacterium]|nr:hypothetical protein [Gammaproteobacteria bacterium]